MELVEVLEGRINTLLEQVSELRKENATLREETVHGRSSLEEEVQELKDQLRKEQALKQAVLAKIDGLLKNLTIETTND